MTHLPGLSLYTALASTIMRLMQLSDHMPHATCQLGHIKQGVTHLARLGQGGLLTSGVNMERGTRVQKKPSETQWVANLRMPK